MLILPVGYSMELRAIECCNQRIMVVDGAAAIVGSSTARRSLRAVEEVAMVVIDLGRDLLDHQFMEDLQRKPVDRLSGRQMAAGSAKGR